MGVVRLQHAVSRKVVRFALARRLRLLSGRRARYSATTDPEDIARWQLEAFNAQWTAACERYAFYRNWRERHRLPKQLASLDELDRFPVLRKHDIQADHESIIRDAQPCSLVSTGGSTGEPVTFPSGPADADQRYATMYLGRAWWGICPGDPIVMLWGHAHLFGSGLMRPFRKAKRHAMDRLVNAVRLDGYRIDDAAIGRYWEIIRRKPGAVLVSYTSSMRRLLDHLDDRGIDAREARLKAVILTADPPDDDDIARVERSTGVVPMIEYGMAEAGVVAASVPGDPSLHFYWDAHYCHVTDEDELIVTSLLPTHFPLINYATGDRAHRLARHRPFACHAILGRNTDNIGLSLTGGEVVEAHAVLLAHVLKVDPSVRSFFIHQKGREIGVFLQVMNGATPEQAGRRMIGELKREYPTLDENQFRFEHLERPVLTVAGKQRITVREP